MNFSSWSIRNPVPALLLFVLLSILGIIGLRGLPIQDFPDMDLPTIIVSASLEGAAPAQLETEVARKIEDKLATLGNVDHIVTTITDGSVSISVSFALEKNGEEALNEVRNAVDSARADLPSSMNAPTVSKVTTTGSAIVTYTIASDRYDEQELSWLVDNELTKALMTVKGVGKVSRIGGVDREVHVDLDPALMSGLGVTASQVSSQLKLTQQDASGGRGDIGGAQQSLRTLGAAGSVADVAALNIPLSDGRHLRLDQIARVSDSIAERGSLAFIDGKQVIGFQITRNKGTSQVTVARLVKETIDRFSASHPQVQIKEAYNTVDSINDNYLGSMHLLLEGAILAVLVVWWFLRDWRATIVSATALPLSIIPTFAAMYYLGFSLNVLSLLSLALVVGILVDDAIVEIENIVRHIRMGKSPYDAAMEAADEIGLAVIATTFTLVAVFLPTAFMSGIAGLFFRQFGITAAVAVVASLVVARLLTPMMAAYFLRPQQHAHQDSRLMTKYLGWVKSCLSHRFKTVAAAVLFLLVSLTIIPRLPTGFVPPPDDSQTRVSIELAPGSTLAETSAVAEQARQLLMTMPDVKQVFTLVGASTSGGGFSSVVSSDVRKATLTIKLTPRSERHRKQSAIEAEMREVMKALPGARVNVGRGGSGEKLELTLASDDSNALLSAAANVERDLRTLKGVGNVTSGAALQRPEVLIQPDFARASALGVTANALADTIRVATAGDFAASLSKLNLPQRQIAIRVRLDPAARADLDTLSQLRVKGSNGYVALSSVADIRLGSGPSQINRLDRERNITLSVELSGRTLGDVMKEVRQLPSMKQLPPGVHEVQQGELQRMAELFGSFAAAMAIGVFCIYAVLVLLFHDFLQPATILAALPLSVGGALFALLVTNSSFSMPSVIGLLMLMGVVTKNSILLVEYAVMARREHGMSRFDALMDACHKRAQPILMTTIAMAAGMLPIALGLGADPSFRQPMAIVVIGGLLTSTVLSLLVVPVVFTYMDDLLLALRRVFRKQEDATPAVEKAAG
ncbi:efflux RND transporter permease subunit [Viridibacterium curvum]|uniref:Efflux RND transporter permease subunit n=1 Tax=Viridibacterium curvum TaxID=1101404 RepID=A0ABP9R5B8_9RHOO